MGKKLVITTALFFYSINYAAASRPRARDFGIPFIGTPGPFNAITDVPGVEVGYTTLNYGNGDLVVGVGPVRTGVTAILPHGKTVDHKIPAGWFSMNGNGEMTGTTWIDESGFLEGPICFTNTKSVGVVRDAVVAWGERRFPDSEADDFALPVVGETWDGELNDIDGQHVAASDAAAALERAQSGPIAEGNVGGGTGMVLFDFKGGTGTSSRVFKVDGIERSFTLGVLVQANFGDREDMMVAGIPVGLELTDLMPTASKKRDGSILAAVGTDAPLLPMQLKAVAKRVSMGIALTGGIARDTSGDIFIAFSTSNPQVSKDGTILTRSLDNPQLDEVFRSTIKATEEAITNVLVAADTMVGINGTTVYAVPQDRLLALLKKYNRLVTPSKN